MGDGGFSARSALLVLSLEEWLGIGLCVPSDLCARARWARFLAAGLRSRRLTEPPRPANLRGDGVGDGGFSARSALLMLS